MKVFDFINHASLKLTLGDFELVTDPWYLSSAFGGWFQHPAPLADDIVSIVESDKQLGVVISHGHDDHLDEFFIRKHLSDKKIFCSRFRTPGLLYRLQKECGAEDVVQVSEVEFGPFTLRRYVNPACSEFDAIIVIKTEQYAVIHANDNWHRWSAGLSDEIRSFIGDLNEDSVFLLIQFGIADCFPVNYPEFTDAQIRRIMDERFTNYFSQTLANMNSLDLVHMYYYANQSKFNYLRSPAESLYAAAQDFLSVNGNEKLLQLTPGMKVHMGHKFNDPNPGGHTIFDFRMQALEKFINSELALHIDADSVVGLKLLSDQADIDAECINYITDIPTWNRILNGELTLESISIGGVGAIYKPEKNIREEHHLISKLSYAAQSGIRKKGLRFFMEQSQ